MMLKNRIRGYCWYNEKIQYYREKYDDVLMCEWLDDDWLYDLWILYMIYDVILWLIRDGDSIK
jgi:hypothetical protein